MAGIRQCICLWVIGILLSACGGNRLTGIPETGTPILTSTPPPYPTDIPTSIPRITPQTSAFPYAPILSDELPLDGLVLAAHAYADNTCYDVGIYQDHRYLVLSCLPGFTYPAPDGILDATESSYLDRWASQFQSFEEPSAHGLLKFVGNGAGIPDYAEKLSIEYLVINIEYKAHEYVSGGGWPPAVFAAQQVLSHQLGISVDNHAVLKFEVVDFPDACLEAPKPDEVCAQVITQGLRIQLVAQGMLYEYHTDFLAYDIRQFGEPQIAPTPGPAG